MITQLLEKSWVIFLYNKGSDTLSSQTFQTCAISGAGNSSFPGAESLEAFFRLKIDHRRFVFSMMETVAHRTDHHSLAYTQAGETTDDPRVWFFSPILRIMMPMTEVDSW